MSIANRPRLEWFGAALLLCAACSKAPVVRSYWESGGLDEPIPEEPEPSTASLPAAPSPLAKQMHDQLSALGKMRQAVIAGDQGLASRISEDLLEQVKAVEPAPRWTSYLHEVEHELGKFDPMKSLPDAAAGLARLTAACGTCHQAEKVVPEFEQAPMPRVDESAKSAMLAHTWAAERMWEGLVGPSDDRWRSGTSTFVALPGCGTVYAEQSDEIKKRCSEAIHLARQAHLIDAVPDRTVLYGQLLQTCSGCHEAVRRAAPAGSVSASGT